MHLIRIWRETKTMRAKFLYCLLALVCVALASPQGNRNVVVLYQEDFEDGTLIIDEPGNYRLGEDIVFNPRAAEALGVDAYDASMPSAEQLAGAYDADAYRLGFFAAIAISASNVDLDLDRHRIEQSAEHALLQRFFAVIELADQPFVPGQGPNNFGMCFETAKHVRIHDGVIGRSSHHGIHGNGNVDIAIEHVDFEDYEVGAVALNGVHGLEISHCTATNRKDVPVLGTFSAAMFIKRYVDYLVTSGSNTRLNVRGNAQLSAEDVQQALRDSVNAVHTDVLASGAIDALAHPAEYALFHNKLGILDGNSYSFLTGAFGVQVNGFPGVPSPGFSIPSKDVSIEHVTVRNQSAFINEIVALGAGANGAIDPVGSVLQLLNAHPDTGAPVTITTWDKTLAEYSGNVVADAQLLVAKAALAGDFAGSGLDVSRLSISAAVIEWAEAAQSGASVAKLTNLSTVSGGWRCNGDSMFHVNKGVIAFKIDATQDAHLKDVTVETLSNFGAAGSSVCGDYSYSRSHPLATLTGYGGAHTRGVSLSGSTRVKLEQLSLESIASATGQSVGVDVFTGSSSIEIKNVDLAGAIGVQLGPDTHHSQVKNFCCRDAQQSCIEDQSLDGADVQNQQNNC